MVLKIASDIRYFVLILMIVLTGFSQAFWLISYPDESLNFGTIQSAFYNSYLFMLGGFDGDFSGTSNPSLGSFLLAMFMFFMAIHMLNLLIALMGETFENVSEKKIPQWRWEQAAIILEEQEQLEIWKSLRAKLRGLLNHHHFCSIAKGKKSQSKGDSKYNAVRRGSAVTMDNANYAGPVGTTVDTYKDQKTNTSHNSSLKTESIHLLRYSGDIFKDEEENMSIVDILKELEKLSMEIKQSIVTPMNKIDLGLKGFKDEMRQEMDEVKGLLGKVLLLQDKDRMKL